MDLLIVNHIHLSLYLALVDCSQVSIVRDPYGPKYSAAGNSETKNDNILDLAPRYLTLLPNSELCGIRVN